MHRVTVLALPDVVAFDLSTPAQVFGNEPGRYAFTACGGARRARADDDRLLAATSQRGLDAVAEADTVLVPGLRPARWPPPRAALDALRGAHARGARVASICTGAFVLAHAGLLDGRRATTHWAHAERLAEDYPAVTVDPDVLYVDEGDVLTSAGVAAGIDLCLHLVRRDHGAEVANAVARRIVVAPHRDGGQAQFVEAPLPGGERPRPGGHARMGRGAPARAAHGGRDGPPRGAAASAPSPGASCAETGTTPLQWLLGQRVLHARRLLEATDLAVEDVAGAAGFGTAASLRSHFRRATATTPLAYRRTFRGSPT